MLARAKTPSEYFAAPSACYFRGRRFICAQSVGGVYGLVAWGRLVEDDAKELVEVLDAAAQTEKPRRQLVDLSQVLHVAAAAMSCLTRYYVSQPEYVETVAREAVVRPDGLVGIFAEGLYRVVPLPFEGRVFRYLDDAFRWLDEPEGWSVQVNQLFGQEASALEPMHEKLREAVILYGASTSLNDAARHCAQSVRSFQRRLGSMETTWPRLRRSLVIEEAQRRILEGERDIKALAHDLGFRAPARFSEAFRAVTGVAPSEWLGRHDATVS